MGRPWTLLHVSSHSYQPTVYTLALIVGSLREWLEQRDEMGRTREGSPSVAMEGPIYAVCRPSSCVALSRPPRILPIVRPLLYKPNKFIGFLA